MQSTIRSCIQFVEIKDGLAVPPVFIHRDDADGMTPCTYATVDDEHGARITITLPLGARIEVRLP